MVKNRKKEGRFYSRNKQGEKENRGVENVEIGGDFG